jgi:hypothetical protein
MKTLIALTLLLIVAKVLGYVAWPWWAIGIPMYMLIFLFAVLVYGSWKYSETIQFRSMKSRKRRPF